MQDEPATPAVEEPVEAPAEQPAGQPVEAPKEPDLTPDQQEEQDALLMVNGNVKGEVKANRPLDEEITEETSEPETPSETPAEDETEAEEPTPSETEEETPKAPEPTAEPDEAGVYQPPSAVDPGDFKPGDYSFSIQTTDGKTHRISAPEDADALAASFDINPELISASQFMNLSRKTALMEQGIANDRKSYDQMKEQYDAQAAQQETVQQTYLTINNGFNYLQQKGILEPVPPELDKADIKWQEHTDNAAIKARLDILQYISEENARREAAGLPYSFDPIAAQTAMELEALRTQDRENNSREKTATRTRGAMVGKKAPYVPTSEQPGVLVGPARGLDDLATEAYYNQ